MSKLPQVFSFYSSPVLLSKITEGFWGAALFFQKGLFWDESLNKLRPIHRDVVCFFPKKASENEK